MFPLAKLYVGQKSPVASCSQQYQHTCAPEAHQKRCLVEKCAQHRQQHRTALRVEPNGTVRNCAELCLRQCCTPFARSLVAPLFKRATAKSYRDLRRASTHLTATGNFLNCAIRCTSSFSLLVYWHAVSVLACLAATGLCVRANVINDMVPDLNVFAMSSSSFRQNPLLRLTRSPARCNAPMCHVWNLSTPADLCKLSPRSRLERLRDYFVFNENISGNSNVNIAQLFRVNPNRSFEENINSLMVHLRPGSDGQNCILNDSHVCRECFEKIGRSLQDVHAAYQKLNATLHRFDCMLAVDTASATRPFSPNGSCADCKVWYRKWLLVQLLNLWQEPPCINWCYYTQLACPHLATSKVADYAGHPSFQCRDLYISQSDQSTTDVSTIKGKGSLPADCNCLHPCDLSDEGLDEGSMTSSRSVRIVGDDALLKQPEGIYDFFWSPHHCSRRRLKCRSASEHKSSGRGKYKEAKPTSKLPTSSSQSQKHHVISRTVVYPAADDRIQNSLTYMDDNGIRWLEIGGFEEDGYSEDDEYEGSEDEGSEESTDSESQDELENNYITEWRSRPRARRRVATRSSRSRAEWRTLSFTYCACVIFSYLLSTSLTL